MQKYYCKGVANYRTILMQVTHEKCKGVGEFVKQFFDGQNKAWRYQNLFIFKFQIYSSLQNHQEIRYLPYV